MKWEDKVYIDAMLPFGLRSAPKIFNAIADLLKCAIKEGTQEKIIISACVNGIPYINGAREMGMHERIASVT